MTKLIDGFALMSEPQTTCHKVHRMTDAHVRAEMATLPRHFFKTPEEWATKLELAIKEFEAFLRDHRSQDMIELLVDRTYENVCSACGDIWEEQFNEDLGVWECACCGVEMEVVR